MLSPKITFCVYALLRLAAAVLPECVPDDGSDLFTFNTRPDIRPPKFNITIYDASASPGYWFIDPYVDLKQRDESTLWMPGQGGPAIYDGRGELVWFGNKMFRERSTFDFKVSRIKDVDYLTFIVDGNFKSPEYPGGASLILDSSYNIVDNIVDDIGRGTLNMHEFNVVGNGQSALHIISQARFIDGTRTSDQERTGWITDGGFRDYDIDGRKTTFSWWASEHINSSEATTPTPTWIGTQDNTWDWIHMNSVDKNTDGDYLISGRFTDTIYKISGKDGSIIWRLGGKHSSFYQKDFNFSQQHDARFVSEHGSVTVISFLDNAANNFESSRGYSAAMYVELDTAKMEAQLIKFYPRPDMENSNLRGNVQSLPNGNTFVGWSDNAYISEHTPEGRVVLEARFMSCRLVSYRAYKFNWTSLAPVEDPSIKAISYGSSPAMSTTMVYASWNGATDIAEWKFYAARDVNDKFQLIGSAEKKGFETGYVADQYWPFWYAEAIDRSGNTLGRTAADLSEVPDGWDSSSSNVNDLPRPMEQSPTNGEEGKDLGKDLQPPLKTISVSWTGIDSTPAVLFFWGALVLFLALAALSVVWKCCWRSRRREYIKVPPPKYEDVDLE